MVDVIRDEHRIQQDDQIQREINNTIPVVSLKSLQAQDAAAEKTLGDALNATCVTVARSI